MRVLLFNSLAPSSEMPRVVGIWRQNLRKVSERAAQSLADPEEYPDLFPDLEHALAVEQWLKQNDRMIPAFGYADVKGNIFRNLIEGATTVYSLVLFFLPSAASVLSLALEMMCIILTLLHLLYFPVSHSCRSQRRIAVCRRRRSRH
jgi:hypothetical protein